MIFKKLTAFFGSKQQVPSHSLLPNSLNPQQSMLHDGSETETRGQLVQVLLRDLVRKSGMPQGWVQCQIQVINSRSRGQGLYVRLVVKHWDERLMKYAFAFQKALLTEIVQFEPKASSWLQGIAWQLEVASTCPLTELPGPEFWQAPADQAKAINELDIVLPSDAIAVVPALSELPFAAASAAMSAPNATGPLPGLDNAPAGIEAETKHDLERLFAIRDKELATSADEGMFPAGYESTAPSPLQKT